MPGFIGGVISADLGPGPGSATPQNSKLFHVAFTAATAQSVDLSGANYTGLLTAIQRGARLTLKATTMCWYNWATAAITIAATSTAAVTPATQGMPLFDGERSDESAPPPSTFLNILGGAANGILAIAIE